MESKKDIRKRVLALRSSLSKREWEEKSCSIFQAVITHPFFLKAKEIYCYIDYRNEAGTKKIIETAWNMEKKVAAPKVFENRMEFYYIESFKDLCHGSYNILEPETGKTASGNEVLVLMPGAAFDKEKHRIGYGKGYYDRYLQKQPDYRTMALAFELQILDKIPADSHDICPQIIVTEEQIYV